MSVISAHYWVANVKHALAGGWYIIVLDHNNDNHHNNVITRKREIIILTCRTQTRPVLIDPYSSLRELKRWWNHHVEDNIKLYECYQQRILWVHLKASHAIFMVLVKQTLTAVEVGMVDGIVYR